MTASTGKSYFHTAVKRCAILSLIGLVACTANGSTSGDATPSPVAAATTGARAAAAQALQPAGVTFGKNWYPVETFGGTTFRWAHSDAELSFDRAVAGDELYLDLEPGPGVARPPMVLQIIPVADPKESVSLSIASRTVVPLAVVSGGLRFHVVNGGHVVPTDPRTLDFRVFSITPQPPAQARGGDVVRSADLRLGEHWGTLEHFHNQTFRWIDNDAAISLDPGKSRVLTVTAAGGPGTGQKPFTLRFVAPGGKTVATAQIRATPTTVSAPIPDGTDHLVLHADGGGQKTPLDPRILNFRVFDIGLRSANV